MTILKHFPGAAFVFVALLGLGARLAIGDVYSASSAQVLLDTLRDAALYIGSACLGGSATILALILTLTGLVHRAETTPDRDVYVDVLKVARNATWAILASIVLLLLLTGPTGDLKELPARWYPTLYNVLFGVVAITLALLAATIARLYLTIRCLVDAWRD